jgi:hypothetical protein
MDVLEMEIALLCFNVNRYVSVDRDTAVKAVVDCCCHRASAFHGMMQLRSYDSGKSYLLGSVVLDCGLGMQAASCEYLRAYPAEGR